MTSTHAAPAAEPEALYGEMRVQTWSPFEFLCVGGKAPLAELDNLLDRLMGNLESAVEVSGVRPIGPVVLRFAPAPGQGEGIHRLEAGYPARPGTPPAPGTEVLALGAFRCAALLYSGPIDPGHMQVAYERLFAAISEAGLKTTGEGREIHLHFDGDGSPNNVVLLQQGIRTPQGKEA